MPNTYTLIEAKTLTASAASITFSSIPATYTDLVVRFSARSDRSGNVTSPIRLYPNGSSTGITLRFVQGDGTSTSSGTQSAFAAYIGEIPGSTATASTFGTNEIYIPNYTSSNYKSISAESATENNATLAIAQMFAYLWSDTAVITSLQILDGVGNFVQYSNFYLYGILKY